MNISQVATASGLPAKTIRYYEDIGLIRPARSANGYRAFSDQDAHKLAFLSRARSLGFSIEDCRTLLALWEDRSRASGDVRKLATDHLEEIDRKLSELHQMTSRIVAQLLPDIGLHDIFAALFPCGSITGAPKIRAMQILRTLEAQPRGAYCGAIGWIAPQGDMQFNVAIRTVLCHADGTARLNVGGGVVYDSTAHDEYTEALLKSRFAF